MSSFSQPVNTTNQLQTNYDTSKIFIFDNRFENADYTNGGGAPVTILEGTLLGRISASGKVIPLVAAASDGSQFPVGICAQERTVAAGATVKLTFCVAGDVAAEKIIFNAAETLETVVSGRRLRDRIAADTVGIKLVNSTDLTGYDN